MYRPGGAPYIPPPSFSQVGAAAPRPHAMRSRETIVVPLFQEPSGTSPTPTDATGGAAPQTPGQVGTPGGPQGPGAGGGGLTGQCGTETFVMMGLFLVLMWLLVLRPESRRRKEQAAMMSALKVGDRVVTIGGMHGTVAALTERTITLRVQDVPMVFDRTAVARVERDGAGAEAAKPAKG